MLLSKKTLDIIDGKAVSKPAANLLKLPVKVLQFGTGALLRGLPDYVIENANRKGVFNGRILVVKSTSGGDIKSFKDQDCLYTLLLKGVEHGFKKEEQLICSAISEVISAGENWSRILSESHNSDLQVVISNTTEVGLQYLEENIFENPPQSFPAKLLAFLHRRYQHFNKLHSAGLVIIPTELIPNNGQVLMDILLKLVDHNKLGDEFRGWVTNANKFCNSLVDRIVTGMPSAEDQVAFELKAGYQDRLMTVSEPYLLWAIEGDDHVQQTLSFTKPNIGAFVVPDINVYRELKLRLLNGSHTLSCALAFLAGFDTVGSAVDNEGFLSYFEKLTGEIALAIPYPINSQATTDFAKEVLDRFRNPFIRHLWLSISQQYTVKLKMRVVPMILAYYARYNEPPLCMANGFAAYIVFMNSQLIGDSYYGYYGAIKYLIADDYACTLHDHWAKTKPEDIAGEVLKDSLLWGDDLTRIPGFTHYVQESVNLILRGEILQLIKSALP